ncbi:GIY-YIG nuclease family protein [Candidatus Collierbacteria bacterium]|nr:GIY-YIG nuclease family protein [Candidatus Collierbacteria bacterium]
MESFWLEFPSQPGIYIFEDKDRSPLYIGKSINLRSRLKQHFDLRTDPFSKQSRFIALSASVYYQTVGSDLEAIILEAHLIKSYQPFYNNLTKDDKSGTHITLSNPPQSKISIQRSSDLNLKDYLKPVTQVYGPFKTRLVSQILLSKISLIFGYCQQPFNKSQRPCFNYHLNRCPGACVGLIPPSSYQQHLTKIKRFLSGKFSGLIASLTRQIKKESKNQNYETASIIKNELLRLEQAILTPKFSLLLSAPSPNLKLIHRLYLRLNHPKLKSPPHRIECYDLANLQNQASVGAMVVAIDGQIEPSQFRRFHVRTKTLGDPHTMKHIVKRRFNHPEWAYPDLIILDGGKGQLSQVSPVIPEHIAVVALSKKRETLHFYLPKDKILDLQLPLHDPVLHLLQQIRDQAHRFATTFHQKVKRRSLTA